jgi:hypothetical protein
MANIIFQRVVVISTFELKQRRRKKGGKLAGKVVMTREKDNT